MNYMATIFVLLFSAFTQSNELTELADLRSLLWSKRIILLHGIQNEEPVLTLFEKNKININERDIVWFVIKGDAVFTNYPGALSKQWLQNTQKEYKLGVAKVTLIGKDGEVKLLLDELDLEALFSEIDAMPMRKREVIQQL